LYKSLENQKVLEDPMKIHAIKTITYAISFIALSFILTSAVLAQSNTGSITGVVTDPNGAVVPNATVVITNQGTNEKRTIQTDDSGRYEMPSLATGIYTIDVTASGFQTTSKKDLRLAVGEKSSCGYRDVGGRC
jgi:hypothetical protein